MTVIKKKILFLQRKTRVNRAGFLHWPYRACYIAIFELITQIKGIN